MNREIAFRVWDTKLKKIIPYNAFLSFDDPEYVFMQYTGLSDTFDIKIYEGDIVKLHDPRNSDKLGEVYFAAGAYHVKHVASLFYGSKHGICEDYEVLGNIYENPELLNNEK